MRVPSSDNLITAYEVAKHHKVVESGIFLYYTEANSHFETSFALYSQDERLREVYTRSTRVGI